MNFDYSDTVDSIEFCDTVELPLYHQRFFYEITILKLRLHGVV